MKARLLFPVLVVVLLLALAALPLVAAAQPLEVAPPGCTQQYVVQCGDTLSNIAARAGTNWWALAQLNGIANPNRIYAGQVLCLGVVAPPNPPNPPHPQPGPGWYYTVQWGDSLSAIAWRTGWNTAYLAQVNHLSNPNFIWAGMKLLIPSH